MGTAVGLIAGVHLALAESLRIFNGLADIDITVQRIICNKLLPGAEFPPLEEAFGRTPQMRLPLSETPLVGLAVLEGYLDAQRDVFGRLLPRRTAASGRPCPTTSEALQ